MLSRGLVHKIQDSTQQGQSWFQVTFLWGFFPLIFLNTSRSSAGKAQRALTYALTTNLAVTALVHCLWKWLQICGTQSPRGVSCPFFFSSLELCIIYSIHLLEECSDSISDHPRATQALPGKLITE